jgi:PAS domain S-box-containing protein
MDDILIKGGQLGSIFDYLSIGAIISSPNREIISINRTAEFITGQKRSDVVGKSCHTVFLNTLCGGECTFHKTMEESLQSGVDLDIELTDQSDEKLSITKVIWPLYGMDKKVHGCIVVFQDHSAFKDLIKRVWYEDRKLKIILNNLDLGVLTVDRSGHVTFFNRQLELITGYSRQELLGKSFAKIFRKKSGENLLMFDEIIANGKARANIKSEMVTKKGQIIPISANYMALKNEKGLIVGGLATISDLSLMYQLNSAIKDRYTFYDMVGRDTAMQKIFEIVPVIAASDATVLIEGPTGTGKDLLAKVIHSASAREKKPLVKVNCAALPDNLLESEMFGYAKGAFTGADKDKPGRFQEADGGTIFLDEIGDLPLSLQAKLLHVLEDREFYPLGSKKTTKVDVRIISATNQDLEQLVRKKQFREDLFYRLNVICLELPSLKDRKGDIALLISHILKRLCATRDIQVDEISEDAMEVLLNYDYPGNIRELENILDHALIICQNTMIRRNHLPISLQRRTQNNFHVGQKMSDLGLEVETSEKNMILEVLKKHNWNKGKTAQALNINRTTLWRKMKKHKILP